MGACSPSGTVGSCSVDGDLFEYEGLHTLVLLDLYISGSAVVADEKGGSDTRKVFIDSARLKELYARYFDSLPTISNTSASHTDDNSYALFIKLDFLE